LQPKGVSYFLSKMKRILVTGGAGFIGSHTVVELVNAGYEPVIIDNFSNSDKRVLAGLKSILGFEPVFHEADCTDKEAMRRIFAEVKPQSVIHFAAFKAVNESVEQPLRYFRNNMISLLVVLEIMQEFGISDLVFSSSCTVYGQPDTNPVTESTSTQSAASPYGYSKQVGEQLIKDHHNSENNFTAVMLRYFNPVGAHPTGAIGELPFGVPNNLVPYITQTAAGLRPQLTIFGDDYNTPDGTCIRDFIHVVDLAKAHVKALGFMENNPHCCEVFNLGQGRGNSVMEAVKKFVTVTGVQLNYRVGERRAGDIEQVWADSAKSNQMLNWKTELSLEDALRDAWNWQLKLAEGQ
jgi:UDP-glucose 4-epimerase